MRSLLTLSQLSFRGLSDEWLPLENISLCVHTGKFVSIYCPSPKKNPLFPLIKGDFTPDSGSISYPNEPEFPIHIGHLCLEDTLFSLSSTFSNRPERLSNPDLTFSLEHYRTAHAHPNQCTSDCDTLRRLLLTLSQMFDLLLLEDTQAILRTDGEWCQLRQNRALSCLLLTSCFETACFFSDSVYILNPDTGQI